MFEILYLVGDGELDTSIDFCLFILGIGGVTIYFLRVEMLLASYSRMEFYFFQIDSESILENIYRIRTNLNYSNKLLSYYFRNPHLNSFLLEAWTSLVFGHLGFLFYCAFLYSNKF